jgi:hypothetical protein
LSHGGAPLADVEMGDGRCSFSAPSGRAPREVVEACDAVATIPLAAQAESLNVAAAGAVAL